MFNDDEGNTMTQDELQQVWMDDSRTDEDRAAAYERWVEAGREAAYQRMVNRPCGWEDRMPRPRNSR